MRGTTQACFYCPVIPNLRFMFLELMPQMPAFSSASLVYYDYRVACVGASSRFLGNSHFSTPMLATLLARLAPFGGAACPEIAFDMVHPKTALVRNVGIFNRAPPCMDDMSWR